MIVRLFLAVTLLAFAHAALADEGIYLNPERGNIIADPEDAFMKLHQSETDRLMKQNMSNKELSWMLRNLVVIRIRGDFNNDGTLDEMLASSEEVGNGGGNFKLYLSDMHGGFHDMGSLVMSSAARAVPVKPGSAKLFSCWHLSAANSNPYGYLIDGLEVKAIPAEPGYPGCGQDNTTYDVCRWKDWKQSGKCEWHTWHELEQLDKRSKENPVSSESKSP